MKRSAIRFCFLLIVGRFVASAYASVSFNKDIAPMVFHSCAGCHRPGQSGPFPLLSYSDMKKRAKQIAEVTAKHYMPPWLPEGPRDEFLGDRRLTDAEIGLFRQWVEAGTPEGAASDLPPRPQWAEGWQLGKPDLIVQMPKKYTLPSKGRDVYRNFVIPGNLSQLRHIR